MSTTRPEIEAMIVRGDLAGLQIKHQLSEPVLLDMDGGLTALHLACASGHAGMATWLLGIGADADSRRHNTFTPLHAAAMNGHCMIVDLLLSAGADPNVQTTPQGYVPLHSAAWAGHDATVRVLLARGARTDLRNHRGETPAETARRQGRTETARLIGQPHETNAGDLRSPQITRFEWGRIEVVGGDAFKDARLAPVGAEAWDWRRTGTRHAPGIQPADFEDLLAHEPTTLILSRGVDRVLQVPPATVAFAEAYGILTLVLQSEEAVSEYNRRCATERVVALIHSTC